MHLTEWQARIFIFSPFAIAWVLVRMATIIYWFKQLLHFLQRVYLQRYKYYQSYVVWKFDLFFKESPFSKLAFLTTVNEFFDTQASFCGNFSFFHLPSLAFDLRLNVIPLQYTLNCVHPSVLTLCTCMDQSRHSLGPCLPRK